MVLGYLPQDFGIYPHLTAFEFLEYLAAVKGLEGSSARRCIDELLAVVNLSDVRNWPLGGFPGGMRQRVGIAQALLNDLQLLIVDEPTAGLDPEERVRYRNLLSELSGERIVILSTHIVSDVEAVATDIAILAHGQLLAHHSPESLLAAISGKVWEIIVPSAALPALQRQHLVSSTAHRGDGVHVRIVSDSSQGRKRLSPRWRTPISLPSPASEPSLEGPPREYFARRVCFRSGRFARAHPPLQLSLHPGTGALLRLPRGHRKAHAASRRSSWHLELRLDWRPARHGRQHFPLSCRFLLRKKRLERDRETRVGEILRSSVRFSLPSPLVFGAIRPNPLKSSSCGISARCTRFLPWTTPVPLLGHPQPATRSSTSRSRRLLPSPPCSGANANYWSKASPSLRFS